MMFDSNLDENLTNEIQLIGATHLLKKIIDWIYSGDLLFNNEDSDVFDLILLADEYLLEDLKRKCEDELLSRLSSTNCLQILVWAFKYRNIVSENLIENCITNLIDELDKVILDVEDVEDKIQNCPGLITRILLFVHQKKHKFKRVAFLSRDNSNNSSYC